MLTSNIIDGYSIPAKDFRISDFPRDMKIPTVDFVYQYIAGLIMRIPNMKNAILAEILKDQDAYKKAKKRILYPDTDLGYLFINDNTELNVQALNILAFFLEVAKKPNKTREELVALLLRMYEDGAIKRYYPAFLSENQTDRVLQSEYRNAGVALRLFSAASKRDSATFSKLVHSLDEQIPGAELMEKFVREAVGEEIWNARTLNDMQDIEGRIFHIYLPQDMDFSMLGEDSQTETYDSALTHERPRVSMLFSNFRVSQGCGIGSSVMDKFVISASVKKMICRIMYLTGNRTPEDMVHSLLTDQRMHDTYVSLVYMCAVSKHCSDLYKQNILRENLNGSMMASLQNQNEALNNRSAELDAKEKALVDMKAKVVSDVSVEYQSYRANSMKREAALKDRIHKQNDQIRELKTKIAELSGQLSTNDANDVISCDEPQIEEPEIQGSKQPPIDYHAELNRLSENLTIAFCGGNQNYINNLQASLPGFTYINEKDIGRCDQAIRNCDVVLFCTQCLGHSLYGKVKKICRQLKIPYQHLSPVTSVSLSEKQIYDAVMACRLRSESEDPDGLPGRKQRTTSAI